MADSRSVGFSKEKEAAEFLKKQGYKILEQNFRTEYGEIDIIAKDKKEIVFVEVRYRKNALFGTPQESVTPSKQQKIIKTAAVYIKKNSVNSGIRFDIVAVCGENIKLIKAAFDASGSGFYI